MAGRLFQHTAARRRLAFGCFTRQYQGWVSTHSRPKAAGACTVSQANEIGCFNTQPPEGGWRHCLASASPNFGFQHTAARRRLERLMLWALPYPMFQHTAARRRLASTRRIAPPDREFQHTAARRRLAVAGLILAANPLFQHTAARRRLEHPAKSSQTPQQFQHTAARRRLGD